MKHVDKMRKSIYEWDGVSSLREYTTKELVSAFNLLHSILLCRTSTFIESRNIKKIMGMRHKYEIIYGELVSRNMNLPMRVVDLRAIIKKHYSLVNMFNGMSCINY